MSANGAMHGTARWLSEALTVYRFVVIGVLAAIVHMSIAWILIDSSGVTPLLGNLAGFLTAFTLSFLGQYYWTFRSQRHWAAAVWRFGVISGTAFLIDNALLLLLLDHAWLDTADATVVAACVIPVISYLGNRLWALK